jgi:uncharacterized membrane protein
MSEQYVAAFKRAGWLGLAAGLVVGLLAGLIEYHKNGDWLVGVIAGLSTMLAVIVGRGGVEGVIDTDRANRVEMDGAAHMLPSDVGYHLVNKRL